MKNTYSISKDKNQWYWCKQTIKNYFNAIAIRWNCYFGVKCDHKPALKTDGGE